MSEGPTFGNLLAAAVIAVVAPLIATGAPNPDFASYADPCGGRGFRVERAADLRAALEEAMAVDDGPAIVDVVTSARAV